jgi:uncharacterized membrane protein
VSIGRVEAFSDGVFAIALTLLVLTIHAPDPRGDLAQALLHLWPSYAAYGLSVLVIGAIWVNHHAMFSQIAIATWPLLFLNTVGLGLVAFLPLPTEVLASALHLHSGERTATFFFGLLFVLFGVVTVATWSYATRNGLLEPTVSAAAARATERRLLVGPTLYAVATGIALVAPVVSLALYAFLLVFFWYPGRSAPAAR